MTVIYQTTSRHRIQVISFHLTFFYHSLSSNAHSFSLTIFHPSLSLSVSVRSALEPGRRERESPERVTFPACLSLSHNLSLFYRLFSLVFSSPSTMKKHTAVRRGEEGSQRTERDDTHHGNSQRKQRRWPSLLSEKDAYERQICAFGAACF